MNEVICHGIPDARVIEDGDIVNIDITAYLDGVHGDTNATFFAGEVDQTSRLLVSRTREALDRGIRAVRPGRRISVIGRVIESFARRFGYGVVRSSPDTGSARLPQRPGDPALRRPSLRRRDAARDDVHHRADADPRHPRVDDVARRLDGRDAGGRRTAQFEHTLLVTETGAEVLTLP